ncbi:MAG: ATP-binding protein [Cellulomonadaceae bacterium]
MRRRIAVLLLPLLVVLVVGIAVPFALLVAERNTQAVQADRTGDAARFASMMGTVAGAERLDAELSAYAELYGSPAWVLGLGGTRVHGSGHPVPSDPAFSAALQSAFAGDRPGGTTVVWPWQSAPLLVVEPVGRDSQVTAVVAIEAPTAHLRGQTLRTWALGAGLLLVPVGALVLGLWPVTRWMLRPVDDLEKVAATVRSGDLDARADVEHGPPELRELASSFNAMVATVQRTLRRQREFVADAAHQLRNPLASLQLSVESLGPYLREAEAREAYDDALAETVHLSATFEAMLSSTVVLGTAPVPDGDVGPVRDVLAAGAPRWRAVLAEAGMTLEVETADADLVPRQPAGGLLAVLDELVANAARLSGGSRVRVGVLAQEEWVRVTVEDDGTGLDAADRESATGRFWRASRHQNVPGTGLGLAIVAELLTDVGGRLDLADASPGLRVLLWLPAARPATP